MIRQMVGDSVDGALSTLDLLHSDQNEGFPAPPTINETDDVLQEFRLFFVRCLSEGVLVPLEVQRWPFFFVEKLFTELLPAEAGRFED